MTPDEHAAEACRLLDVYRHFKGKPGYIAPTALLDEAHIHALLSLRSSNSPLESKTASSKPATKPALKRSSSVAAFIGSDDPPPF